MGGELIKLDSGSACVAASRYLLKQSCDEPLPIIINEMREIGLSEKTCRQYVFEFTRHKPSTGLIAEIYRNPSTVLDTVDPFFLLSPENTLCKNRGCCKPTEREYVTTGPGALVRGIPAVLAAPGGSGKTQLEIELLCSGSAGRDLTGGIFHLNRPFRGLGVFSEDDDYEVNRRLWALEQEFGTFDRSNLFIVNLGERLSSFELIEASRDGILKTLPRFKAFLRYVEILRPDLIVLDPLGIIFPVDDFQNRYMAQVIGFMRQIGAAAGGATVLLSQHFNKVGQGHTGAAATSGNSSKALDNLEVALSPSSVRGGTALVNNARWCASMVRVPARVAEKLGHEGKSLVAFQVVKSNYSPLTRMAFLEFYGEGLLRRLEGDPDMDTLHDVVNAFSGMKLTENTASKKLPGQLGITRVTLKAKIAEALEKGLLVKSKERNANGVETEYLIPWHETIEDF